MSPAQPSSCALYPPPFCLPLRPRFPCFVLFLFLISSFRSSCSSSFSFIFPFFFYSRLSLVFIFPSFHIFVSSSLFLSPFLYFIPLRYYCHGLALFTLVPLSSPVLVLCLCLCLLLHPVLFSFVFQCLGLVVFSIALHSHPFFICSCFSCLPYALSYSFCSSPYLIFFHSLFTLSLSLFAFLLSYSPCLIFLHSLFISSLSLSLSPLDYPFFRSFLSWMGA